jgi:hypothetical protein
MPDYIADVTIFARFALDDKGLTLKCKNTKSDIMGFFNPIPPFMMGHEHPSLCIVYKKKGSREEGYRNVVHIDYFKDKQDVIIELNNEEVDQ